jgi:hypothetical protein
MQRFLRSAALGLLSLAVLGTAQGADHKHHKHDKHGPGPERVYEFKQDVVAPAVAPLPGVRPLTLGEFTASFRPRAGTYEVILVHPHTGYPVVVRFTLPPGCPKKFRVHKHDLEFDYGKPKVKIHFGGDGLVKVECQPKGFILPAPVAPRPSVTVPQVPSEPLPLRPPPPPPPEAAPILPPPTLAPSVPPETAGVRPLTLAEFGVTFRPAAGNYEVPLVHPRTGCPVMVRFTLPPGYPRKFRADKDKLEFDYGRAKVKIHFEGNGRVKVEDH